VSGCFGILENNEKPITGPAIRPNTQIPKYLNIELSTMLETFFFFIGGVQPKVKVLDETPRRCPRCGLHQARLKRVDHYLSVFFIPVLKVKTGEPMLICDRCEMPVREPEAAPAPATETGNVCRFCKKNFPAEYAFCPVCGRRL
jgi:hypothetical protein